MHACSWLSTNEPQRSWMNFAAVVLVGLALAALASPAPAMAGPWSPVVQGCVRGQASPACAAARAADGLWLFDVSPDRRNVYAVAWEANTLLTFDRDPGTGVLTQRGAGGCLSETGSGGLCVRARGLQQPVGVKTSPDGRNVYVAFRKSSALNDHASYGGGGVAMFQRNPATGDLTQPSDTTGCLSASTATSGTAGVCARGRGLGSVESFAMSPDGQHLYTAGKGVSVLHRDPDTGVLTQNAGEAGCLNDLASEGCAPARGLGSTQRQIAIAPDGMSVYVPHRLGHALAIFERDPASGRLRQAPGAAGCLGVSSFGDACGVEPHLVGAKAAIVSPDNRHLYVSADQAVLTFARGPAGQLTLQSCVNDGGTGGCGAAHNLSLVSFSAISPDGQALVVHNEDADGGLAVFRRDAAGVLTQSEGPDGCVTADGGGRVRGLDVPGRCTVVPPVRSHGALTFVDDGNLLVGSYTAGSVTSFKRDHHPVCRDQVVTVALGATTALPFACFDRNGDALAFEVTRAPLAGAIGGVEHVPGRVFYSPFTGTLGADSLRYRAHAGGFTSNEASLRIDIVAAPPPPLPAGRPGTVASPVRYAWRRNPRTKRVRVTRLTVQALPAAATVTVSCTGKPTCGLKSFTLKRGSSSTLNVRGARASLRKRQLLPGQRLELRISAPGMHTKLVRFKVPRNNVPDAQVRCIPIGAKHARRTCA